MLADGAVQRTFWSPDDYTRRFRCNLCGRVFHPFIGAPTDVARKRYRHEDAHFWLWARVHEGEAAALQLAEVAP